MSTLVIERVNDWWAPKTDRSSPKKLVTIEVENRIAKCNYSCNPLRGSIRVATAGGVLLCRAATSSGDMSRDSAKPGDLALCGMVEQPTQTSG